MGGGTGVTFKCSVHAFCEEATVVNNVVANNQHPLNCQFIETYNVSGNSPASLEECMRDSMNRSDVAVAV